MSPLIPSILKAKDKKTHHKNMFANKSQVYIKQALLLKMIAENDRSKSRSK